MSHILLGHAIVTFWTNDMTKKYTFPRTPMQNAVWKRSIYSANPFPKICIVIPARMHSTRFPRKPLAMCGDKTLINTVYERCAATHYPTFVLTESLKIAEHVRDFGGECILTSGDHENGTSRCAAAAETFGDRYDYYVNVQGDMIDITIDVILKLIHRLEYHKPKGVTSCYTKMNDEDRADPNTVKVLHDSKGKAMWFLRSSLPYGDHHLGVYAYPKDVLLKYNELEETEYEYKENLEQLRFLMNDIDISLIEVEYSGSEINTEQDLKKWREINNHE